MEKEGIRRGGWRRIKEEGSLVGMDQTRGWFSFFFIFLNAYFSSQHRTVIEIKK